MENNETTRNKMAAMLEDNEQVLWEGSPVYKAFFLNRVLHLLPIAVLWLGFDMIFIVTAITSGDTAMKIFMAVFMLFHLMPVWKFIGSIITAKKVYENEYYIITDKRILLRHGFIGFNVENIYYQNVKDIHLHVGVIDRLCNVGDIIFQVHNTNYNNMGVVKGHSILDISDVETVFGIVQKATRDIASDVYYPNDLRPEANHGYNTTYHQ